MTTVAFPPNYRQERSNRERSKQAKALEKQARRDEKSQTRKHETDDGATSAPPVEKKDE
jgi:hypothetical protein